jgi:mycothione reductase
MRVDACPASMVVLGGGAVAAEFGHVFGAFGTKITIVEQEPSLLANLDHDLAQRFTEQFAKRFDVRVGTTIARVERREHGVAVHLDGGTGSRVVEAEALLVAIGRTPNTDTLDVAAAGLEVDDHGKLVTDDTYATNDPRVWAIGDVTNRTEFKHLANAEMRIAVHNVRHPGDTRRAKFPVMPSAVFADPQVATAGPTEHALREQGATFAVARHDYADTAYGWALEDTTSFVKLIGDPKTRRLLAAHIIGPQAATLLQPLVQGIFLGNTVEQMAHEVLYIHPAPTEVISQALLALLKAER